MKPFAASTKTKNRVYNGRYTSLDHMARKALGSLRRGPGFIPDVKSQLTRKDLMLTTSCLPLLTPSSILLVKTILMAFRKASL